MKRKKILLIIAFAGVLSVLFTACSTIGFYDQRGKEYNTALFYRNDLLTDAADPSVIYVTEGSEAGYFYMYATSDDLGVSGFYAWRSRDLNHWEIISVAFTPHYDSWGITNLWAPEVIFAQGKYWLYYSATNYRNSNRKGISVAVSDSPKGPFHEYTGLNYSGKEVDHTDQLIMLDFAAIDASPFIDDNGDIYLYFAKDQVGLTSTIYGVKMLDMVTPDLTTLIELTNVGKSYVGEIGNSQEWERRTSGRWNEAPFMIKHDGKYYLTYSANPYTSKNYGVGVAVGGSPLGEFIKPTIGNPILQADPDWDHVSGTGHHSFVRAGEELFAVYHAHKNREFGAGRRAVAADRVFFDGDGNLFIHGPTWSVQPLPAVVSGYSNIAADAEVTVSGSASVAGLLTDNRVTYRESDSDYDFNMSKQTTITFKFKEKRKVRAVLIYNTYDYDKAFTKVDSIELGGDDKIIDLKFNEDYIGKDVTDIGTFSWMRPGGAAIAEFAELTTDTVKFTFKTNKTIAVSEIVILGA